MQRLAVLIALLLVLGGIVSPVWASTLPGHSATAVTTVEDGKACLEVVRLSASERGAYKPCARKVFGQALLPCHLPPSILPGCIIPSSSGSARIVRVLVTQMVPGEVASGHFRPPRGTAG